MSYLAQNLIITICKIPLIFSKNKKAVVQITQRLFKIKLNLIIWQDNQLLLSIYHQ